METLKELDLVVLVEDLPQVGFSKNLVGTLVMIYENHQAYEVEFMTYAGKTLAVLTLLPHQIRKIQANELMAVQTLAQAA